MEATNRNSSRDAIIASIRSHLSSSKILDAREHEIKHGAAPSEPVSYVPPITDTSALMDLFKQNLEAVNGRCLVVHGDADLVQTLGNVVSDLRDDTKSPSLRIAISDSPDIERLVRMVGLDVDEIGVTPSASDVFRFDVGVTCAQAGIAETGTLVLDSSRERHRLVSLVPPVHIAILNATQIVETLGEALSTLRLEKYVSPIVTLVTGPSRTADIELTLAIGVHGPQELIVILRA